MLNNSNKPLAMGEPEIAALRALGECVSLDALLTPIPKDVQTKAASDPQTAGAPGRASAPPPVPAMESAHDSPSDVPIVLFGQENHVVFTPLLGNVVGSSINPMHVVWPVRQMLKRVNCRTAAVTDIDLENHEVHYLTAARLPASQKYQHLILACGNVVKLDIVPGMSAHAWPLKTMGDALVLRNHLIGLLEKAQVEPDAERRNNL